ncbi:MAG: LysR substrate-binding domain-containing protein [Beijerinckiaceae bacterium]|jgi:aminoethylphosphonate catabolism LysR family transcriptional regulator|nr:LysR substrate-binding domain-containing protein [Beijerinckiaceae bacterium]
MSITGLRAFHAVARAGSFTRAAEAAGISQPTLSSQVRLVEERHDAALFDRKGRGVALTPLGQKLLDITTRLFAAEEEAKALLEGVRTVRQGHLRIAADSATHAMPLLARMRDRAPGLTFSLRIGNSSTVLDDLLDYRADIAITARPSSDPRFTIRLLRRDRVVLFAPSGHRLASRRAVPLADLAGQDLVIRERGSVTREVFESALAERGITPGMLIEVEGRESVREAVAAGFGLGIVFESEMPPGDSFRPVAIADEPLDVAEYVACLAARAEVAMVRSFLDLVSEGQA